MKAFRKDILLQIGPIQTTVNLYSVAPSSRTSARLVCPDHTIPLKQQYRCIPTDDSDEHVVPWGTWDKAVETPKGWRKVNPDERPTLEAASKVLELTPVPSKDINENTFATDTLYWVGPSNEAAATNWTILVRQIKTGKTSFVTRGGFKKGGIERLWRLEMFRGFPVLRQLQFPDTINDAPDTSTVTVDKETQNLVNQFITARMSSWDDMDTTDRFEDLLTKWVESGELIAVPDADSNDEPKQTHEDMIAALNEAVKNTQT
jgi:hypothetical protein